MLYAFNLYSGMCQLYLSKIGKNFHDKGERYTKRSFRKELVSVSLLIPI